MIRRVCFVTGLKPPGKQRGEVSVVVLDRTSPRPTSSLSETPPLLAPNVFDYEKVALQPRFTCEGDPRGQGHGHAHDRRTSFQYHTRGDADIGENLYVVLLSSSTSTSVWFRRREQLDFASCPGELFDEGTIAVGARRLRLRGSVAPATVSLLKKILVIRSIAMSQGTLHFSAVQREV